VTLVLLDQVEWMVILTKMVTPTLQARITYSQISMTSVSFNVNCKCNDYVPVWVVGTDTFTVLLTAYLRAMHFIFNGLKLHYTWKKKKELNKSLL